MREPEAKAWVMPWPKRKRKPLVKGNDDDKFIWMADAVAEYKKLTRQLDAATSRLLRTRAQLRTAMRNNDQDHDIRVLDYDVSRAFKDLEWAIEQGNETGQSDQPGVAEARQES